MSSNIITVDQATYERCIAKIEETEVELAELLKNKGEAASHHQRGADWQETPICSQIEMREQMAKSKLEKLKKELSNMKVDTSLSNECIRIGSMVTLLLADEDDDEPEEMQILLVVTAPKDKRDDDIIEISKGTELGRAIFGKKVNEIVRFTGNNDNQITVKILKIH